MFIDAFRRRVEPFWYIVLLLPAGALIYFFFVKLKITELLNIAPERVSLSSGSIDDEQSTVVDIAELRSVVEKSPSFANRIRLAQSLADAEQFEEAIIYYQQALQSHPKDNEALYGLGLTYLEINDLKAAIQNLTELVDENLRYDDYQAARILVQTLWQANQREEAFNLLEDIIENSPELRHRVTLAHYLIESDQAHQASEVLSKAIENYNRSSEYIQKREARWASEAHSMLLKLRESQ